MIQVRNFINKILTRSGLIFNQNSGLVKIWFGAVMNPESSYKYVDVPNLSNLHTAVGEVLVENGYDIENDNAA